MDMFSEFHFLRPFWLLAIVPLVAILYLTRNVMTGRSSWNNVIQPHLLQFFTQSGFHKKQKRQRWLIYSIVSIIVLLALAGPTFERIPVPTFQSNAGRVILLDLSHSMNAEDVSPSRLTRANFKIQDLLNKIEDGEVGLVVFGGDAFVISPLTSDTHNIESLIPALNTQLIPTPGSRPDLGLIKAMELLKNSGVNRGQIIMITDGFSATDTQKVAKIIQSSSHRVDAIFIGTEEGAPIPSSEGGFIKDNKGAVVISKLNISSAKKAFASLNSSYERLSHDDSDIEGILRNFSRPTEKSELDDNLTTDEWKDLGPYLLLLTVPLFALMFRQGFPALLLLCIGSYSNSSIAIDWQSLWQSKDQQASTAFSQGEHETAAQLFEDPAWQASALYKAGQFDEAAKKFASLGSADGFYNQGNALAKASKLPEALEAYKKALELAPDNQDILFNKNLVEELLKKQQDQNQNSQNPSDDKKQENPSNEDQQSQKNQESAENQKSDSADNDSEPSQNNESTQQDSQSQPSESESSSDDASESNASQNNEEQSQAQQQQKEDSQSLSNEELDAMKKEAERQEKMAQENNQKPEQPENTGQPQPATESNAPEDEQQKQEKKQVQTLQEQQDSDEPEGQAQKPISAQLLDENLSEEDRKVQQWLKKIPDDPGGLLRRKMLLESRRREKTAQEEEHW